VPLKMENRTDLKSKGVKILSWKVNIMSLSCKVLFTFDL
jgi:hypothetical protein